MSDADGVAGVFALIVASIMILGVSANKIAKSSAEKYIKSVRTEAVERGYGKWMTDPQGNIWFEWVNKEIK